LTAIVETSPQQTPNIANPHSLSTTPHFDHFLILNIHEELPRFHRIHHVNIKGRPRYLLPNLIYYHREEESKGEAQNVLAV
jgi:hypothetical protein